MKKQNIKTYILMSQMKSKYIAIIFAVIICGSIGYLYWNLLEAINRNPYSISKASTDTVRKDSVFIVLVHDSDSANSKSMVKVCNTGWSTDSLKVDSIIKRNENISRSITNNTHKVDSLSTIVDRINGQYVSVIDMLIDKFNTWVGFWLALLSLILLIVSVWQYLKIDKYKERIDKLEVDSKKEAEGIQKQSESLEIQMSNLQKQAKVYLDTQISVHQYSTLENRMTSLLLCMSSVPDPQVFSNSEERKEQVNYYLGLVSGLLIKYFKLIEQESECHKLPEETVACIPMVLLNLRLSLIRIQGMFRDPGMFTAFVRLSKLIKKNEESIRRTQLFGKSELKGLGVLVKSFNDFKTEIANCNEVV